VGFSPDGTRIVTGSWDQTAKVWDAVTGEERLTFRGHKGIIFSVSFSPDGTHIATGGGDRTVCVWDAKTNEIRLALRGHADQVYAVNFSPDGTRIVTGSGDHTAKVWDAATGEPQLTLRHASDVLGVNFSPDGTHVVTATVDKTVKVWDAVTGEERLTLQGHTDAVLSANFSPDGTRIVTTGWGTIVRMWDTRRGAERLTLPGLTESVRRVGFSSDGALIFTIDVSGTAKVWDTKTGELLPDAPLPERPVNGIDSPDGRWKAVIEVNHVYLLDQSPDALELRREVIDRRREYLTRIARFDALWHDRQAHDAETLNNPFAAEFHCRLLVEHAPDHLGWHERRLKALKALKRDAVAEEKIIAQLKASPPELIAAPHLEPLPPPGPRARIKLFNPLPPNFDD